MTEVWTPVPGWEKYYWVSTHGRVLRSCDRFGNWVGRVLKGWTNEGGYRRVRLQNPNRGRQDWFVHQMVLRAFVGPRPGGLNFSSEVVYEYQACHEDGNPDNNFLNNLRWGTLGENYQDQRDAGTNAEGERNGMSKLTDSQRTKIRASYEHRSVLAKRFGVSENTIRRVRAH